MLVLPLLAPADPTRPATLYHNKCLHVAIYLSAATLYPLYMISPIDITDWRQRALIVGLLVLFSFVFTTCEFLRSRRLILAYRDASHLWWLLYSTVTSAAFVFGFVTCAPSDPSHVFILQYIWGPLLIPYALTTFIFYALCMMGTVFGPPRS